MAVNDWRSRRLRSKHDYLLMRGAERFVGKYVIIEKRKNFLSISRLGMTVTRRHGNAPMRNRFKRVVREAFRQAQIPEGWDLLIRPRSAEAKPADIIKDLLNFF